MRHAIQSPAFRTLALIPLLVFAGCKSSGHDQVEATSSGLSGFKTSIETLRNEVTASAESLARVVEKAEADPKADFQSFQTHTNALESSFKSVSASIVSTRSNANQLFTDWDTQAQKITDPELREISAERREKLKSELEEFVKDVEESMKDTKEYVAQTKDLSSYLSQDLTPAGIKSISGKAKSQGKAGKDVAEQLDDVAKEAGEISAAFATAKPPPPPKQ